MSPTRRRARQTDPVASTQAVEAIIDSLRPSLPEIIHRSAKDLFRMLQAVRGLYMRRPADTNRGRPARFPREHLLRVDSTLWALLARETSVGVRSFVGQSQVSIALLQIERRKQRRQEELRKLRI